MDAKLNIWQTRNLTSYFRIMLVKSLGISKIVYAASKFRLLKRLLKQHKIEEYSDSCGNIKKDKVEKEQ